MKVPSFLAELETEQHIHKLRYGVTSGFAVTGALLFFGVLFDYLGYLPNAGALYLLAPLKFATNLLQWWSVSRRKWLLPIAALNTTADVLLITAIIYLTGGPQSNVFPLYLVLVGVLAVLSNVGVTILASGVMAISYAVMVILIKVGVLVQYPPIFHSAYDAESMSWTFVASDVVKVCFFLFAVAFSMASVQRLLGEKEDELREKNEKLREASRLKDEFVANVTHELRTPIHGILGLSEMLGEGVYGEVSDDQTRAVDGIRRSAMNLLTIVDDLLSLERAGAGKLETNPETVGIGELLREVKEAGDWMRGSKQLQIEVEPDDGVELVADRQVMRHILTNLLSNAIKFTPDGGHIELAADEVEDVIELRVSDDGVGIARDDLELIFESFRQADGSMERTFGGSGLGLSVVRTLTDALGGEVRVESELDRGTTFTVRLPKRPHVRPVDSS